MTESCDVRVGGDEFDTPYGSPESSPNVVATLNYLLRLALNGGGYERCGVRGWARREEVEEAVGASLAKLLPRLYARGRLDRDNVADPTRRTLGLWVYRITQESAAALGEATGMHPIPLIPVARPRTRESTAERYYLPPGCVDLLAVLREELRSPSPVRVPEYVPGEPGWYSVRDLSMLLSRSTGRARHAFPEDYGRLVACELLERREVERPGWRRNNLGVYRLTPKASHVFPLDWRDPAPAGGVRS